MLHNKPQLSIVIPAYNERGNISILLDEIDSAIKKRLQYEVVVVDDASTDGTAAELAELAATHETLKISTHQCNRGQSAAIHTGVIAARASVIAILDGDGQNDPADILNLYGRLAAGSGIRMVVGIRRKRQDSWTKKLSSRVANVVRSGLLKDGVKDTGCGLKVFRRRDYLALPAFDHMHRFLPALVQRKGGKVYSIEVNHRPRMHGVSKYGVNNRLWVGIFDLLGVMWLRRRML